MGSKGYNLNFIEQVILILNIRNSISSLLYSGTQAMDYNADSTLQMYRFTSHFNIELLSYTLFQV